MLISWIRAHFGRWAESYDSDTAAFDYSTHDVLFDTVRPYLERRYGGGNKSDSDSPAILDCGIGTGLCSVRFYEAGYHNITGIDLSRRMLEQCRQKSVARRLVRGDILKPDTVPLETGAFNLVIAGGVMEFIKQPARFLRIATQYLRPRGLLAFTHETPESLSSYTSGFLSGVVDHDETRVILRRRGRWFGLPYYYRKYLYDPLYIESLAQQSALVMRAEKRFEAYRWNKDRAIDYKLYVHQYQPEL